MTIVALSGELRRSAASIGRFLSRGRPWKAAEERGEPWRAVEEGRSRPWRAVGTCGVLWRAVEGKGVRKVATSINGS